MSNDENNAISLIYIGSVLPDTDEYNTPVFSRAGSLFQRNLLTGLIHADLMPDLVVSYRQVQSYPGSKSIIISGSKTTLLEGLKVNLLPFINITPIKQISLGLATLYHILVWGWRNKGVKQKVVYTFNLSVPPGVYTLLGARIIGAKAVVSLNDINIPGQTVPNSFFNKLDFLLHKIFIPKFDGHISVSDQIMADFSPSSLYIRIEGGISEAMLNALESEKVITQKNKTHFHIVAAGSLDEANGVRVLLKAFSLLPDDCYRLSIAGNGPLRKDVIEATKSDSRITYHGLLPISEVLSLYTRADVLVNMRLTELINTKYFYPSKMMEYLASGTPVITTCTGHTEEEFGSFVFLLKDETPEGLANLIDHVSSLDYSARQELGSAAQNYMRNNKTWDLQGLKVTSYLKNLF